MKRYRQLLASKNYTGRTPIETNSQEAVDEVQASNNIKLPVELVIEVLRWLSAKELMQCRTVSKQVRVIIDETPELQYTVELYVAGYEDNSECPLDVARRMKALVATQESWKRISFLDGAGTRVPPGILDSMANKRYYGNLFVGCSKTRSEIDNPRLWDTVRCLSLEPQLSKSRKSQDQSENVLISHWTMQFQATAETFAADAGQNLLILLNYIKSTTNSQEWFYEIRTASLTDGSLRQIDGMTTLRISAPIRHFQESPGLQVEGDRIGIATGHLSGTIRDEARTMHLTIVNHHTGQVEAHLSREHYHGIEFAAFSFLFISQSSFLVALSESDCFVLEMYILEPDNQPAAKTPFTPSHIRTFQFPLHKRGFTSIGTSPSLTKSCPHRSALKSTARPFYPSRSSSLLHVNRAYLGTRRGAPCYPKYIIALSLFLDAETQYVRMRASDRTAGGTSSTPIILPWKVWGPSNTRLFVSDMPRALASYGSRVMIGMKLLDYNELDFTRDACRGLIADPDLVTSGGVSGMRQWMKRMGSSSKSGDTVTESPISHRVQPQPFPGHVVRKPTVIRSGPESIFVEDVVTLLPYRVVDLNMPQQRRKYSEIYGGEVWVNCESSPSMIPYRGMFCYDCDLGSNVVTLLQHPWYMSNSDESGPTGGGDVSCLVIRIKQSCLAMCTICSS
ncbi:hypothetical protein BC835DRAFT_1395388 [Cytidiella melzeri]|nr:hypothetical protein BC835DRAFT_1395388 [Cytidiella melzeri]